MVFDTSALLALLLDEPEAEAFRTAVEDDTTRLVSAATLLETALVIEARKGEPGGRGWWTCTRGEESEVSSVPTPLSTFRERFAASRLLIGVLHVGALPGTPRACDSIGMLIRRTADEAQVYRDAGFPAVVIENMH